MTPLLDVRDLAVDMGRGESAVRVVDGVSFSIQSGETLCLVGESGCGKSVTAMSLARLNPSPPVRYPRGEILIEGEDVLKMSDVRLRSIRGGVISYVFQEPAASLNPVFRIGTQIKENLKLHRPEADTTAEVIRLLKLVGIPAPEERVRSHPHELSGGMQQRVMIAMALASQPNLLVADEPTTALDVTIQAQIIDLLRELKRESGMSMLLISHNLGVVGDIADRIAVMYAGQIVESGPADAILRRPLHPYTQALIASVPTLGDDRGKLVPIPGSVPMPGSMPKGCRFHPRCPRVQSDCSTAAPELAEVEPGRLVRCPHWNLPSASHA